MKSSEKRTRRDTTQFAMLCEAVLQRGLQVRFLAHGRSMQPNVLNGDAVIAEPVVAKELRRRYRSHTWPARRSTASRDQNRFGDP